MAPTSVATVLGARRHPAVVAPMGNGKDYVSIYTSTGFQKLKNGEYCRDVERLQPDIAIPLADLTFDTSHTKTNLLPQTASRRARARPVSVHEGHVRVHVRVHNRVRVPALVIRTAWYDDHGEP